MSRLRVISQAALVAVLIVNPFVAWWASSINVWWLPGLTCAFVLFYVVCAVLMRSPTITGAILGGIVGAAVCGRAVISSRAEQIAELTGIITFVVAGAICAALYHVDMSQGTESQKPNSE